jgi:DNA polymerase-3 subunit epsilon/ATP-dependent DNA helicase DinG
MARRVLEVFKTQETLLVEAGTGIGKSLAYLVPAALWSLEHDEPVIVSTHTRALQEQLLHKDLPVVSRLIAEIPGPRPFKAVSLKGRSNYVCRERWQAESSRRSQEPGYAAFLSRIHAWLAETRTGDKAELDLDERDDSYFERISAAADECAATTCRVKHGNKCFFARARSNAQRADLVVVNHALLFSDQGAGGTLLPQTGRLIVDEAHHLEAAATRQFSRRVSAGTIRAHLDELVELKGASAGGMLPVGVGMLASSGSLNGDDSKRTEALQQVRDAIQDADALQMASAMLFDRLAEVFDQLKSGRADDVAVRIRPEWRVQPAWSEVEQAGDDLVQRLRALANRGNWLFKLLSRAIQAQETELITEAMINGLAMWLEQSARIASHLEESLMQPDANGVYWLDASRGPGNIAICSAPLDVGEWISATVLQDRDTIVMTSATLSVGEDFTHFRRQTGIEHATELVAPSPFDYRRAALVYLADDVPEPAHPTYEQAVSTTVLKLATAIGGRTLVLFTSTRHLRQTAEAIRGPLGALGIDVWAQWVDGAPQALAERLRADESAVVLGAASMWEGIDVQGAGLSALVVVRLPFDVPGDPLFQARSEQYLSPFYEYSVPRAVLRFRQGFGRLIRSPEDRGVFVVLDRRIITKAYGRAFLDALPGCQIRRGSMAGAGLAAHDWIERQPGREPARTQGGRGG